MPPPIAAPVLLPRAPSALTHSGPATSLPASHLAASFTGPPFLLALFPFSLWLLSINDEKIALLNIRFIEPSSTVEIDFNFYPFL